MKWVKLKAGVYKTEDGLYMIREKKDRTQFVNGKWWTKSIWNVFQQEIWVTKADTLKEAKQAVAILQETAKMPVKKARQYLTGQDYLDNMKHIIRTESMPNPPQTTWEDWGLPQTGPLLERQLEEAETLVDVMNVYLQCNVDHDHYDIITVMAAAAIGKQPLEDLVFGKDRQARIILPEGLGHQNKKHTGTTIEELHTTIKERKDDGHQVS